MLKCNEASTNLSRFGSSSVTNETNTTHEARTKLAKLGSTTHGSKTNAAHDETSSVYDEANAMHHHSKANAMVSSSNSSIINETNAMHDYCETNTNLSKLFDMKGSNGNPLRIQMSGSIPSYSNAFKEKMMIHVARISSHAASEIRAFHSVAERGNIAWKMDRLFHLGFLCIVTLTFIIALVVPPNLHL